MNFSSLFKSTMDTSIEQKQSPQRGRYALLTLVIGAAAAWLMIVAFARTSKPTLSSLGVASMVAAASMLAGALFGFIFGVPKALQNTSEDDGGAKSVDGSKKPAYRPNTNLEQISDWLTKILVGAGLTQISGIRQWLRDLGVALAPGFGASESARVFATATVVCYVLNGFLIGYLWTRLYLAGALVQADDLESLAREVKDIKQQSDLDARALALAIKQMNPAADSQMPTQQELNDAIKTASQNIKAQIFYQAQSTRQETWSEPSKKAKMERTIPIFRALIASDTDDAYHRNHGQLGYALKDQRAPDWTAAESELSKAIQIRGSAEDHDWVFYEMNRAQCRIMTDDNFKQAKKSTVDSKKRICDDLKVALSDEYTTDVVRCDSIIKRWMELNELTIQQLIS